MAFVGNYRLLVGRKGRTFDEDWPKLHPEGQKVRVSLLALVAESGVILHHGVRTVQGHLKSRNQRANVFKYLVNVPSKYLTLGIGIRTN